METGRRCALGRVEKKLMVLRVKVRGYFFFSVARVGLFLARPDLASGSSESLAQEGRVISPHPNCRPDAPTVIIRRRNELSNQRGEMQRARRTTHS